MQRAAGLSPLHALGKKRLIAHRGQPAATAHVRNANILLTAN